MSTNIELLEEFGNVRRSLGRMAVQYGRDLKIGPKQLVAIRFIGKKKKCTMAEIAEGTNSDKASVTRIINSLVETGWLERQFGTEDRRQIVITLSVEGARKIPKIEKIYSIIAERFASSLNAKEQKELLQLFTKIKQGLS